LVSRRPEPIKRNRPVSQPVRRRVRWELLVVILVSAYLLFQGLRGVWKQREMTQRYQALLKQIETELNLKEQQQGKLARLQDPRYIEFLARDRLGLVKRGEKVYKLTEPQSVPSSDQKR
jgi:cell division protein FtsB